MDKNNSETIVESGGAEETTPEMPVLRIRKLRTVVRTGIRTGVYAPKVMCPLSQCGSSCGNGTILCTGVPPAPAG